MKKTKYYKITDINNKSYVGKTTNTLQNRLNKHRGKHSCSSKRLDLNNCEITELLEITPLSLEHSRELEQYFITTTENVVNMNLSAKYFMDRWPGTSEEKALQALLNYMILRRVRDAR